MSNLDIEAKKKLVLSPEKIITNEKLTSYIKPLICDFNKKFTQLNKNNKMIFYISGYPVYQINIDDNKLILVYLSNINEYEKKQFFNNTHHGKSELLVCLSLSYLKKKKIIKKKINYIITGEWKIEYLEN